MQIALFVLPFFSKSVLCVFITLTLKLYYIHSLEWKTSNLSETLEYSSSPNYYKSDQLTLTTDIYILFNLKLLYYFHCFIGICYLSTTLFCLKRLDKLQYSSLVELPSFYFMKQKSQILTPLHCTAMTIFMAQRSYKQGVYMMMMCQYLSARITMGKRVIQKATV